MMRMAVSIVEFGSPGIGLLTEIKAQIECANFVKSVTASHVADPTCDSIVGQTQAQAKAKAKGQGQG